MFKVSTNFRMDQAEVDRILKSEDGAVGRFGVRSSNRARNIARSTSPRVTGTMAGAITVRSHATGGGERAWTFRVNTDYAKYVIEGGGYNNAKPNDFLEKAVEAAFGT